MNKHGILMIAALLTVNTWSEPVNILVLSKTKTTPKYKSSIAQVVADGLNKTDGLLATAVNNNVSLLTKENLAKYDVLFLFHAPGIGASAQSAIVSLVKSGDLGFVASHDALRDNKEVRELVGMTKMYTDYFDMQKIWSVSPGHPITLGVPDTFDLNPGQPYVTFTVNSDVNMIFKGHSNRHKDLSIGWTREPEKGRTFYFAPDHETYATYNDPIVQKILSNAAFWVAQKQTGIKPGSIPELNQGSLSSSIRSNSWNSVIFMQGKSNQTTATPLYNIRGQSLEKGRSIGNGAYLKGGN